MSTTSGRVFDVSGKTAVVTGASSGLGVTFAEALAEAGANVVLAARRTERLEALADSIAATGGTAVPITCDVADPEQVEGLLASACDRFGRVDIMVNNAGVAADAGPSPERLPHELFQQTMQVNLSGVWYGCRAAGARMLRDGDGGSIVNISAMAGLGACWPTAPAYQASKAAVIQLTRVLASSWADRGVRVNAIAPGYFPSELADPYLAIPSFLQRVLDQNPMGRVGDPRELVGPLLFLASAASSYMTGQTVVVDGGLSASIGAPPFSPELVDVLASAVPAGLGERIMPQAAKATA
jgi:NAD(P)-dependent dehydrogenase (short-subunit alcohol dehydrogenase family)